MPLLPSYTAVPLLPSVFVHTVLKVLRSLTLVVRSILAATAVQPSLPWPTLHHHLRAPDHSSGFGEAGSGGEGGGAARRNQPS